jgi:hypothetical protein
MQNSLKIDVSTLDASHRRALEEVIGRRLEGNQWLIISVLEETTAETITAPPQTLEEWTNVYEGLSDEEIDAVDKIVNTRANLTRELC